MYRFEIVFNGELVHKKYSLRSAYNCVNYYKFWNESIDLYVCEYRNSKLYYTWSLDAFVRYCRRTFS